MAPGRGCACDAAPGAASGGDGGAHVDAATLPRCRRLRLVRPGGQPCHAGPGAADGSGHAGLVLRPRLLGRRVAPGGAAQLVRDRVGAAPGTPVVGRGERHGDSGARRCAAPREDGMDRPRYVREHLGAVVDAVASGVPVHAYFHWSLMDNYEWGTYEPRYGLFGIDRTRPRRRALHGHRRARRRCRGRVRPGRRRSARRGPLGAGRTGLSAGAIRRPASPSGAGAPRVPRSPPCSCGGGARRAPRSPRR